MTIGDKIFSYIDTKQELTETMVNNYRNSLIFIGDEQQIYNPLTGAYVGIGMTYFNQVKNDEIPSDIKLFMKGIFGNDNNKLITDDSNVQNNIEQNNNDNNKDNVDIIYNVIIITNDISFIIINYSIIILIITVITSSKNILTHQFIQLIDCFIEAFYIIIFITGIITTISVCSFPSAEISFVEYFIEISVG